MQTESHLTKKYVTVFDFVFGFSFARRINGRVPLPRARQSRIAADTSLGDDFRLTYRIDSSFCIRPLGPDALVFRPSYARHRLSA